MELVHKVAKKVFIPFTVGGGIRTVEDIRALLREGADKVSVNSAAINTPELIREASLKFGSQCIVVAIDAKRSEEKKAPSSPPPGPRPPTGPAGSPW